jgi:hypothetical protein
VKNRYIDGILTEEKLWPWPYQKVIKKFMCNSEYLKEIEDTINNYEDTNIKFEPALCASGKTLTDYIWSYLGNPCPADICDTTVNIQTLSKEKHNIKIYPNPSNTIINIESEDIEDLITIYNLFGSKVFQTNKNMINVSQFKKGTYIIEIKSEREIHRKVIIID